MNRPRLARLLERFGAWLFARITPVDFDALDEYITDTAQADR